MSLDLAVNFGNVDLNKPEQVVALVKNIYSTRRYHKYALERQWFLNIAWFAGYQNLIWSPKSNSLEEPPAPNWRVRMVVNILQSHIRTLMSKYYKSRSEWDVVPATDDQLDISISQIDKQLLEFRWQQQQMPKKFIYLLNWLVTTGNAFFKICWDPDAGDTMEIEDSDLVQDLYLDPKEQAKAIRDAKSRLKKEYNFEGNTLTLGDTLIKVKSPFEVIVDTKATCMEDTRYLLDTIIKDRFEIEEKYNTKIEGADEARNIYDVFNFQRRLNALGVNNFTTSSYDSTATNTLLHELWIKPTNKGKFREGRHIIVSGNKLLKNEPFPYKHLRKLPYVHFPEIITPGRFWASSTIEQLMPIQSEYNKGKSQVIENRNLMSRGKWLMPKGHGIDQNSLTSEPGECVEYNPGFEPKQAQIAPLPNYVQESILMAKTDMEDVSGIHEASNAEAPGEVRSGRGILALLERDDSKVAPVITFINESMAEVGRFILMIDAEYITEERIAKVVGSNDEIMIFTFSGEQLIGQNYGRPGADYFDVRVTTIPGMPNSPQAQIALIDNLLERGVLNGEKDREMILRLLNIGKVQRIIDKSRVHRSAAYRENLEILKGVDVPVLVWQDHQAHIEVHNEFRNSIQYNQLPPEIKQKFDIHDMKHKEAQAYVTVEPQVLERKAVNQLLMAHGLINPGVTNGQEQTQGNEVQPQADQQDVV